MAERGFPPWPLQIFPSKNFSKLPETPRHQVPLTVGLERKPETSASLKFGSSLPKVSEVWTILDVGLDGPLGFFF